MLTCTSFILGITVVKHLYSSAALSAPALYPINQGESSCGLLDSKRWLALSHMMLCIYSRHCLRVKVPLKHLPRHATVSRQCLKQRNRELPTRQGQCLPAQEPQGGSIQQCQTVCAKRPPCLQACRIFRPAQNPSSSLLALLQDFMWGCKAHLTAKNERNLLRGIDPM